MRIGILGGAFDPIHKGHLALARAGVKELKLDRLIFVPSYITPLVNKSSAPAPLRLAMIQESIKETPQFAVSDIELKREGVSYTIDTLQELRKEFPAPHELFFIVGADWANRLSEWKNIDQIFSICQFVVASRLGCEEMNLPKQVRFLNFSPLDVSATKIREAILNEQPAGRYVPKPALEIIRKHHLYQNK